MPDQPNDMVEEDNRKLAIIERGLRSSREHIARLEKIIEERRRDGRDTSITEEILQAMRTCQIAHDKHRALLRREIASAPLLQTLYSASREAIAHSRKLLGALRHIDVLPNRA